MLQLPFNFDRVIDGLSRVILRGGVVGKVTFAVTLVSFIMALIAWTVSNIWLSAATIFLVFIFAISMFWRLINFADRHPQAALLEGAEFLIHEQIVHTSKSMPTIPAREIQQVQPEAIEGPAADPKLANIPDQEVPTFPNDGDQR